MFLVAVVAVAVAPTTTKCLVQSARWTEGLGKWWFQHCRPGHSGLGVQKTHNTKVLWEKCANPSPTLYLLYVRFPYLSCEITWHTGAAKES